MACEARESVTTSDKRRGRLERRTLTATTVGIDTCRWPGAKQFLRLRREVTVAGETTVSTQYAVTSLSRDQADTSRLLRLWRSRWAIENRAFWVREVVFREDASRIRTGRAPHVLSVVRNSAITLLRGLKHRRSVTPTRPQRSPPPLQTEHPSTDRGRAVVSGFDGDARAACDRIWVSAFLGAVLGRSA